VAQIGANPKLQKTHFSTRIHSHVDSMATCKSMWGSGGTLLKKIFFALAYEVFDCKFMLPRNLDII
jgi:hypothetical protein